LGISLGQVVVSRAGRDAGRRFVVVKVVDDFFVEIADGDLRKIEKPKRKKVKHLNITDERAFGIEEILKSGAKITNAEIRKALADLDF
jgi:large subunit ribosomal protein L14e